MRNALYSFRLKFSAAYTFWTVVLVPVAFDLILRVGQPQSIKRFMLLAAVVLASALFALFTYRGRRLAAWVAVAVVWLLRRRRPPEAPSEASVGRTTQPGDSVAVRWEGRTVARDDGAPDLVAVIELIPRPFTPTIVTDGEAHTDDVLDTELLEQLMLINCPDLEADVVSAGYRVAHSATPDVVSLYEKLIDIDPAPAYRRTWIMVRADPQEAQRSAQRRDTDVPGLARYLVASTTRLAEQLAAHGVDAVCASSFDAYDDATSITFTRENWSTVQGPDGYTAAYAAPAGPDAWWSVQADRTITRVRITPGQPPRSTVLLTTVDKPQKPKGFRTISGSQREALGGRTLMRDRHRRLPIGSAGVLVGKTQQGQNVYLPFDSVDASVVVGDARTFTEFAVRSAAAGGAVTLQDGFDDLASLIGAHTGAKAQVEWHGSTTYLGPRPGLQSIVLQDDVISIPGGPQLRLGPIGISGGSRSQPPSARNGHAAHAGASDAQRNGAARF